MRATSPTDLVEIFDADTDRQYGQVESVPGALAAAKVMAQQYMRTFLVKHKQRHLFRVSPIIRVKVEMLDDPSLASIESQLSPLNIQSTEGPKY